jgi:PAS domain S-box-containing protein
MLRKAPRSDPSTTPQATTAEEQALVDQDAAALLYRHGFGGIAVSLAASTSLALLPGPEARARLLWFFAMGIILCTRFVEGLRWRNSTRTAGWDGQRALRRFGWGVAATAAVWASYPILFFPSLGEYSRTGLAVILAAMAGGSTTVLAASELLATGYCAALLLPASLMFVLSGGSENIMLGLLGALYFVIMAASARVTHRAAMTAIIFSRKNQILMRQSELEQRRTEFANAELRTAEAALQEANLFLETRIEARTAELAGLNERLRAEIVEREAAQRAVADREVRFRTLIENASDVIFVSNAAGRLEYVSPTAKRVLGYEPSEMVGRAWIDFVELPDLERALAHFRETLNEQQSDALVELRVWDKNGSVLTVEVLGNNQIENPAVRGVVMTLRDITGRRHLEEQFRQAQKMEALGRLAGGVAHDFNNLLTVICGYSALAAKRLPEDDSLRGHITQIRRAGDRAAGLVEQLLAFSRRQVIQPQVLDLNDAIRELERMLHRLIGEDIELRITPSGEALHVNIDRVQLDQIVMNLSVNARDVMPQGGALTISTYPHISGGTCLCQCREITKGDFAILAVKDTGTGITEDALPHIFDPFFTTKEVGKGTGLGLSMVYGAIEQAGGHICVETESGKGTTFRIYLPRVQPSEPVQKDVDDNRSRPGNETILLVEDEELVRTMAREAIEEAGYQVLEAHDGEDALKVVNHHPSAIHLVVTDVVMPKMGGRELALQLTQLRPDIRVLFVSGYPGEEWSPGCSILKKPFSPEELIREVRTVLDQRV